MRLPLQPAPASVGDAAIDPTSKIGKLASTLDPTTGKATDASVRDRVIGTGVAAIDTANVQAAITAAAGRPVYLVGTFAINDRILLGTSFDVRGLNAKVISSLPLNGGNFWFLFYAVASVDATVTATTLAAPAADGDVSVSSVGTVAAGKWIRINALDGSLAAQTFQVVSVSGSGPYTLTLDRPVRFAFATSDTVGGVIPPMRSRIGGLQISGTGARAIQIAGSIECSIYDTQIDGVWDWGLASFDLAGRDNAYHRITGSNTVATGGLGLAMEGQVGGGIHTCDIAHCKTNGLFISSCRSVSVSSTHIVDANIGIRVDAQVATTDGCEDVSIVGCSVRKSVQYSLYIADKSKGVRVHSSLFSGGSADCALIAGTTTEIDFVGCEFIGATTHGCNCISTASPSAVTITNCVARNNGVSGFRFSGASMVVTVNGIFADSNAGNGVQVSGATLLGSGIESTDGGTVGINVDTAGQIHVTGISISRTSHVAGWRAINFNSTKRSTVHGGTITMVATSSYNIGVHHEGTSTDALSGLTISGSGGATFYGVLSETAGSIRLDNVDASGCTTPTSVSAPATITQTTYA